MSSATAVMAGNRVSFSHPSGVLGETQVIEGGSRRQGAAADQERKDRPPEQDHDHDGRNLHDVERVAARFVEAAGVAPPEVHDDAHGEHGRELVPRDGQADGEVREDVGEQRGDVEAGRDGADRAGQDVVEEQRRHRQFRHGAAHGLLDDAVDAAADEHHRALDVDRPHGPGEEHHGKHEPRRGAADGLFGDAAHVERGRAQIAQHDGGGPPERDEREEDGGRHDDPRGVRGRGRCVGCHARLSYLCAARGRTPAMPVSGRPAPSRPAPRSGTGR